MSKYLQCDVCETTFPLKTSEPILKLTIPGALLESEDDQLKVDICSPRCLTIVAEQLAGTTVEEPEAPQDGPQVPESLQETYPEPRGRLRPMDDPRKIPQRQGVATTPMTLGPVDVR